MRQLILKLILTFKLITAHAHHQDALHKSQDAPQATCDSAQEDADESTSHLATIEVVHSQPSDEQCQQPSHATTLARGTDIKHADVGCGLRAISILRSIRLLPIGLLRSIGWLLSISLLAVGGS